MLCTAELDMADSVTPNDIDVFLDNVAWAISSTYHTVLKASPGAAIFGCNMLFDILFVAYWHIIGEQRQSLTDCSNQQENAKHIDYNTITKLEIKYFLLMKVSSAKQSLHTAKSHGLSLQFIWMELSGFNTEPKWNDLASGDYNHLQMILYKLGKIYTTWP
jgi:hypothetical protein